ncbi:hypothetical protein [Ralstonia phage RP12]|uniref:Uncharacterized protein n=1 Tax=Ralstonia phage RP12 TaxID=1923889 RepID=A0A1L7N0N7_9CAUD|nr:hypothetical protein FDH28_gp058 [Ralstonia phage RP12]BAW19032.1 hypothetical protein [Ralstonia phage RP12]
MENLNPTEQPAILGDLVIEGHLREETLPEATAGSEEPEEEAKELFNPVVYLTNALTSAGYTNPTGWLKGIDPRAETAEDEKDRIFFANRALRLYLAEVPDRENISPRMLLADGITSVQWTALVDQGVVPWLMNQFDKKGKRVASEGPDSSAGFAPAEGTQPWAELPPDAPIPASGPVLKEFDGTLSLSEDEKNQLRAFSKDSTVNDITIGQRTFMKVHRNGASCLEWQFVSEPNVSYPLKLMDLWGDIPAVPEKFEPGVAEHDHNFVPEEEQDARPSSTEPDA